jgi:hypothetical protein
VLGLAWFAGALAGLNSQVMLATVDLPSNLPHLPRFGPFGIAMIVMLAVNATGTLRISKEGELYGMDLHEHGISAYPEYVISSMGAPGGMPSESVHRA